MLSQSPDSDLPVGFTSFSQDLLQNDASKRDDPRLAVDMSFAESARDDNDPKLFH